MSQRLVAVFSTFEELTDPRVERTRRHELFDLIVVALCGTIAGADSWADIERFGDQRLAWLRTFLRLENGPPKADRTTHLAACSRGWIRPNWGLAWGSGWTTWAARSESTSPSTARPC